MELLHLPNKSPSSLHESTPHVSVPLHHRSSCVDSNALSLHFPPTPSPNFKWGKNQMADSGRLFDGLSLPPALELSRDQSERLILSHMHSISGENYCRIGRDAYRLGLDLHVLPPRKLRKLLTTFSDGLHVFSCVERVGASNSMDFECPGDGFDPFQSLVSKKRPWLLCGMSLGDCESVEENSEFLGLSNMGQRFSNPILLHDRDNSCTHDVESGGSSNGGGDGQGGDGEGNNGFGPDEPGSSQEAMSIMVHWHGKTEGDGTPQESAGVNGMDIATADCGNTLINDTVFLNGIVTRSTDEKSLPDSGSSEMACEEPCGMSNAPHQFLYEVLENLRRAISPLHAEPKILSDHGQATIAEENLYHIPLWQIHAHPMTGVTAPFYDHVDLQADLQDIDAPLAEANFPDDTDIRSKDLLEKVKGLTLGSVKHLLPQAEHMQIANSGQAERDLKAKEANGGYDVNQVLPLDNVHLLKNYTRSTMNTEEDMTAEQPLAGRQLHAVMGWLGRLAHGVAPRNMENHHTAEKEESHIEDQRFKNLVNEAVISALKQLSDDGRIPTIAKQADTETLRRLQREVFLELMRLREKVDQVALTRGSDGGRNLSGGGKTVLKGEVNVGTAFVMLEDCSSRHARGSLEQAGMQTGVNVRLAFETPFRENDVLITECIAGQGSTVGEDRALGGPMSLGKVHYLAHVNDSISISFVPIGAQGMDVTDIVNPMQDQGLTAFSSCGPSHFDHCKGSAIGATWSGRSFAVSAAQYLSGWGNQNFSLGTDTRERGPLCLSTLGQLLLQPSERLIFSLSGVNRFWPSPPLPSSMGLHWSEMGPLVIPKIQTLHTSRSTMSSEDSFASHGNSLSSHWGMLDSSEYHLDAPDGKGTSLLSVAVASEMDLSQDLSLGAWAQVEMIGDVLQDLDKGNFQWALNLSKASKRGIDWGTSIGSSRPDFWSVSTSEQEMYPSFVGGVGDSYGPQLHVEAFMKLHCGKGFTLQPGLLYLLNKHSRTPAFVVRSSWLF